MPASGIYDLNSAIILRITDTLIGVVFAIILLYLWIIYRQ